MSKEFAKQPSLRTTAAAASTARPPNAPMQRFGNQHLQQQLLAHQRQAKLAVGDPGGFYEAEADRVADELMSVPDAALHTNRTDDSAVREGDWIVGAETALQQSHGENTQHPPQISSATRHIAREIPASVTEGIELGPDELAAAYRINDGNELNTTGLTQYLQMRVELGLGVNRAKGDEVFVRLLARWQKDHELKPTGALDRATRKKMIEVGIGKQPQWYDKQNMSDRATVAEAERFYPIIAGSGQKQQWNNQMIGPKRYALIAMATSQVGTASAYDRGDGKKFGWENIYEYYKVVYGEQEATRNLPIIQKPGMLTDAEKMKYQAWSWCGIYLAWVVKKVTGKGGWNAGPVDFGDRHEGTAGLMPGDIANLKDLDPANPLNHFCLVVSRDKDRLRTINGNGSAQQIMFEEIGLDRVSAYYSPAGEEPEAQGSLDGDTVSD